MTSTTTAPTDDHPPAEPAQAEVEEFLGQVLGQMTGAATVACTLLGHHLGLYTSMSDRGPLTAEQVAAGAGTHTRLTREWLDQQAAAGSIVHDATADTYELPPAAAAVLAHRDSPVHVAGGLDTFRALFIGLDTVADAFRGDGAVAWGEHDDSLFVGAREHFRPAYLHELAQHWVPALAGIPERLATGGAVADVGCGHGVSSRVLATTFPEASVTGFDLHEPSIEHARRTTDGLDNLEFVVADALDVEGRFDLVALCDSLHDMGDPVGVARHLLSRLAPDGSILLVEPRAEDTRAANHVSPLAGVMYAASTFLCTPNSLSQPVGRALGAQAGESGLRAVVTEAGAGTFSQVAATPFNLVYEVKAEARREPTTALSAR